MNTYIDNLKDRFIDRLVNEWIQHGKIVIGVDYDETFSPWRIMTEDDIRALGIIDLLRACQYTGCHLVCFTSCNKDRYPEIQERFKEFGLRLDSINKNPITLPYGNEEGSKIYYNIFLDDRAGLGEALYILTRALYKYRGYQQSQQNLDDVA